MHTKKAWFINYCISQLNGRKSNIPLVLCCDKPNSPTVLGVEKVTCTLLRPNSANGLFRSLTASRTWASGNSKSTNEQAKENVAKLACYLVNY